MEIIEEQVNIIEVVEEEEIMEEEEETIEVEEVETIEMEKEEMMEEEGEMIEMGEEKALGKIGIILVRILEAEPDIEGVQHLLPPCKVQARHQGNEILATEGAIQIEVEVPVLSVAFVPRTGIHITKAPQPSPVSPLLI